MNNFSFQNFINEQNELHEVEAAIGGLTQNQAHTSQRLIQIHNQQNAAYQAKRAAKQQQRAEMTPQARAQADAVANQERIARNAKGDYLGRPYTIPNRTPHKTKLPSILGGTLKALPGEFTGEVKKQIIDPVLSGDPWAIAGLASTVVPVVGPAVKTYKAGKAITKAVKGISKTRGGRSAARTTAAATRPAAATTNAAAVAQTAKPAAAVAAAEKPVATAVSQAAKPAAAVAATGKAATGKAAKSAIGRPHTGGPLGASPKAAGTAAMIGRGVKRVLARAAGEQVPLTWLRSGEVIRGAKMAKRMGKQILGRAGGRSARGTGAAQIAKRLAARTAKQSGKQIAITHAKRAAANYALSKGLGWGLGALYGGEGEGQQGQQGDDGSMGSEKGKDSGSDIKAAEAKKRRKATEAEMYKKKNKESGIIYKLPDEEDDKKKEKNESVEQVMQQISTGKNFGGWTDEHLDEGMGDAALKALRAAGKAGGAVKDWSWKAGLATAKHGSGFSAAREVVRLIKNPKARSVVWRDAIMANPRKAAALGIGASVATGLALRGNAGGSYAARALDAFGGGAGGGQQGARDAAARETGADIAAGQLSRGSAWDDKHRDARAGARSSQDQATQRAVERQARQAEADRRRKENLRQG